MKNRIVQVLSGVLCLVIAYGCNVVIHTLPPSDGLNQFAGLFCLFAMIVFAFYGVLAIIGIPKVDEE